MKKLYLKNWDFNTYIILNEVRKEIEKKGGFLVDSFPHILKREKIKIYDRSIFESELKIKEIEEKTNSVEYVQKFFPEYLKAIKRKYKKCRIVENTSYLHFYYENFIYYIQIDSNPFFNHYIQKEKAEIVNNEYITKYSYYLEKLDVSFIPSFAYLTDAEIKKYSKKLLEIILNHAESEKVIEKKRVANYYNNGWHHEKILVEKKSKYKKLEKE